MKATGLRCVLWLCVAVLGPVASALASDGSPTDSLRVMSFNIRLPVEADGADRWEVRKPLAVRILREQAPDVIGLQELTPEQAQYLATQLPDYGRLGRGREVDGSGEQMGVFYRTDRLRVVESGDFWLSDTPQRPGSISWGHLHPRMVTWALFERVADGRRFYMFNTHLPYREQDEAARVKGAQAIADRAAQLPADVPVVLTGDFNTGPDSAVHTALAAVLADAWAAAPRRAGPAETFHAFTGQAQRRIDWIFTRGMTVDSAQTVTTQWEGRYPSDHFPVVVELRLQ